MTASEFESLSARIIDEFAAEQVRAGNWDAADGERLASEQVRQLLPQGPSTPDMLLLTAESLEGAVVGHVWLAMRPKGTPPGHAWIYDIEVAAAQRGRGLGRRLLAAAEAEASRHGATSIGLNVFGTNRAARGLYETSGYQIKTLQMRKDLTAPRVPSDAEADALG
jgi:ribosomal protein S18 acetylase RimI-like enzyme